MNAFQFDGSAYNAERREIDMEHGIKRRSINCGVWEHKIKVFRKLGKQFSWK